MPALAVVGVWAGAAAGTTAAVTTGALVVGTAASVAGAGVMAYSQYQAGKSAQAIDNYNASLAQKQAIATRAAGASQGLAQRHENARILAKERAGFAANGVVGSTGSPLIVQVQDAGLLELRAQQTEFQANVGGDLNNQQAQLDYASGRIAKRAGVMNAGASILKGASTAISGYYG